MASTKITSQMLLAYFATILTRGRSTFVDRKYLARQVFRVPQCKTEQELVSTLGKSKKLYDWYVAKFQGSFQ